MPRLSAPPSGASGTLPRTVNPLALGAGAALSVTANRAYFYRVTEGDRQTISKIAVEINTQDATANVCVSVHRTTGSGASALPGTRVATSGAVACPAAGVQQIALDAPVEVGPGDWIAIAATAGAGTMRLQGASGGAVALPSLGLAAFQDAAMPIPATPAATAGASSRVFPLVAVP